MQIKSFFYSLMSGKCKCSLSILIFKIVFIIPSFIYLIAFGVIKRLYRFGVLKIYRADARIISVGNITAGGTGKTPFVETLVEEILSTARKPAVLIRGYGDDETQVLSGNLPESVPVLVGKDRIKNISSNKHNIDTFILDDGFQYIKLFRDLDIVLVDTTCPFGNGLLLPCGLLREPLSNLKRSQMIILTKTDFGKNNLKKLKEKIIRVNPKVRIFESIHRPLYFMEAGSNKHIPLNELKGKKACLVSGIADNESFYDTISSLGIEIKEKFFFSDHYQYTPGVLKSIMKKCAKMSLDTLITTQKDYVRIKKVGFSEKMKILVLRIKLEIKDEQREEFKRRIFSIYSG